MTAAGSLLFLEHESYDQSLSRDGWEIACIRTAGRVVLTEFQHGSRFF